MIGQAVRSRSSFVFVLAACGLCACAAGHKSTAGATQQSAVAPGPVDGMVGVEDTSHAVRFEVPPAIGGWQNARDGSARIGGGVQVEIGSFALAGQASAPVCRDSARSRLTAPPSQGGEGSPPHAGNGGAPADPGASPAESVASPAASQASSGDGPREQTIGESPTSTWSFTSGSAGAPVRSRWAFYPRGADCVILEVTGPLGDPFAESVFTTASRSLLVQPLSPEVQREVDLRAGMRFLEQREPASALDRFEALARREPDQAKAHFGVLMAGFEIGPSAYARALPHGEAALKAERELSPEQLQLALRAVGVMQLAQGQIRGAADTLAELVVRAPELAEGQYNYACALARLGDSAAALDHLRSALRVDASLAAHARGDDDLKSLRGTAAFEQLTQETQAGARTPPKADERGMPNAASDAAKDKQQ